MNIVVKVLRMKKFDINGLNRYMSFSYSALYFVVIYECRIIDFVWVCKKPYLSNAFLFCRHANLA